MTSVQDIKTVFTATTTSLPPTPASEGNIREENVKKSSKRALEGLVKVEKNKRRKNNEENPRVVSLLDLPPEIVFTILAPLDARSLLNALLTCKTTHDLSCIPSIRTPMLVKLALQKMSILTEKLTSASEKRTALHWTILPQAIINPHAALEAANSLEKRHKVKAFCSIALGRALYREENPFELLTQAQKEAKEIEEISVRTRAISIVEKTCLKLAKAAMDPECVLRIIPMMGIGRWRDKAILHLIRLQARLGNWDALENIDKFPDVRETDAILSKAFKLLSKKQPEKAESLIKHMKSIDLQVVKLCKLAQIQRMKGTEEGCSKSNELFQRLYSINVQDGLPSIKLLCEIMKRTTAEEAEIYYQNILSRVLRTKNEKIRNKALHAVAKARSFMAPQQALHTVTFIQNEKKRIKALTAIAHQQTFTNIDLALSTCETIPNEQKCNVALYEMTKKIASHQPELALEMSGRIQKRRYRAKVRYEIAKAQAVKAKNLFEQSRIRKEGITPACTEQLEQNRSLLLDQAKEVADQIEKVDIKIEALCTVIQEWAKTDQFKANHMFNHVLGIASTMEDPFEQVQSLSRISLALLAAMPHQ